ncbi:hypothetical protein SAMN05421679_107231 [Epilithonimonas pallida]|uniref:Uncharacterized protein n=1 Tax=Epilithonimonas pallida TaxID=373671 RepID=A0ABY1R7I7_9FLAO|nr:hypothetical protein SAMN05421679_107231 [Epilithonimonas pallida]
MKNITTITSAALLIAATNLSAQVGINTDTPKSTLDVVGKATDTSSLDGITAPRLTGDQLRAKTYTSAQTGTLVYVTVADTAPAGQTVNVTTIGYFYFDGTVWQKVNTGTNASVNIYNADGTLTNNRTLTQASRTLTFLGTNQSTTFFPNNGLSQTGIAGSKRASIALSSNDNNSDGASSNLQLFQDPEQMSQIIAGNDSRGLSIGTSFTTQPTPITFITATGNTSGIERARITPTGNFGVNTQGFASEKFDVNGIARIRTLPLNGTTNAINTTSSGTASASQDQTFSATRTVVADANGVLGTVNYIPPVPVVLAGADGSDATGTGSFTLESKNDVLTEATLTQRTFSVTKKSLVTFSYSVGIGHIEKFGGGNLTDGLSKQIGSRLVFSAVPLGSPYTVGNTLIRSAMPFSTAGAPSIAGYFYLNGTEMLILDPGSYTVDLRGYVSATDNNQGIRALLDGASDRLNIVAIPMQ